MKRLVMPPTCPKSYSADSCTDRKLTGLTIPKKSIACDQSIQFDTEALAREENNRWGFLQATTG